MIATDRMRRVAVALVVIAFGSGIMVEVSHQRVPAARADAPLFRQLGLDTTQGGCVLDGLKRTGAYDGRIRELLERPDGRLALSNAEASALNSMTHACVEDGADR